MTRHAKASSAGSTQGQGSRLGRILRGAFATRGASSDAKGSGAPSARLALTALLATAAALLLLAPTASAATIRLFSSFGSSGSGAGQLSSPSGVAVNQTSHDVYVADSGNARVDQFSSSGTFIRAWGWGVEDGTVAFQTCTATCQAGIAGSGAGQFTAPAFVAVDQSTHDVYVGDTGTNLVSKFSASGSYLSTNDGSTATAPIAGPFGSLAGIAVDASGNLWVYDQNGNMFEFAQDSSFTTDWNSGRGVTPGGIGVDSAGNLYVLTGGGSVEQFSSTGTDVGPVNGDASDPTGLAIDPSTNDVYMDSGGALIRHYPASCDAGGSCTATETFGSGDLSGALGLGVDPSSGAVFAADSGNARIDAFTPAIVPDVTTGAFSNLTPVSATLAGHLDPAGGPPVIDCHFEYTDDASFQANGFSGAATAACLDSGNNIVGTNANPITVPTDVHADITGLSAETTYHYRLLASNANGANQGSDQTFTTPPAVKDVTTGAASNLGRRSATLNGSLDPNGVDATYSFQWGTDTSYGHTAPVPDTDAGSGVGAVAASTDLTGLQPGTIYHFRLLATSSLVGAGTTVGLDQHFLTAPAVTALATLAATNLQPSSATLNGSLNPGGQPLTGCHFEYGTNAAYGHSAPCEPGPAGIGSGSAALEVHAAIGGLAEGLTYYYRLVATNAEGTTDGALTLLTTPSSPVPSSCPNEALRTGLSANLPDCRAFEQVTPAEKGATQDLFGTGSAEAYAIPATDGNRVAEYGVTKLGPNPDAGLASSNVFSRTASGWRMTSLDPPGFGAASVSGFSLLLSPHLSQVGFTSLSSPTVFVPPADQTFQFGPPGGPYTPLATIPNAAYSSDNRFMGATPDFSHLILSSFDHSPLPPAPGTAAEAHDLYEFTNGQLQLVNVTTAGSLLGPCGATLGAGERRPDGVFRGTRNAISNDGSRIFFTDNCTGHLYMRSGGVTTDVSAPDPGVVDPSGFGGAQYAGAAADGSKVFFASSTLLTPAALASGNHFGASKLYEYETATQTLTWISAVTSDVVGNRFVYVSEDGSVVYFVGNGGGVYRYDTTTGASTVITNRGQPANHSQDANYTTPDGRFFVFTAVTDINGDNPSGTQQIYRYDSASATINCLSCAPAGIAPADSLLADFGSGPLTTPDRNPMFTSISDDGNYAVFTTSEALVPQDVNGQTDVYEWEADGAGACTQPAGCVSLISQGNSQIFTKLLGISSDGRNIFFATHAQLVPQDIDTSGDIYDARIGGGFPPPAGTGPCEGDSCSHPVPAPNDPTPASETFHGAGNPHESPPLRCSRRKVLRHGRCVAKRHRKRHGAKHGRAHKRAAGHNRGGSR